MTAEEPAKRVSDLIAWLDAACKRAAIEWPEDPPPVSVTQPRAALEELKRLTDGGKDKAACRRLLTLKRLGHGALLEAEQGAEHLEALFRGMDFMRSHLKRFGADDE